MVSRTLPAAALPDSRRATFAVVGAHKAGTTTLHHLLGQHPQIWTSAPKEAGYFMYPRPPGFPGRPPDHSQYHRLFAGWTGEPAIGEAHPGYMHFPEVSPRIRAYNPAMRLVFILRDPAARAFSHYMMLRNSGLEKLAFGDALGAEPYRHRRSIAGGGTGGYRYVTFGLYMQHIKRMLEHFPRSQMHFMRTEDLNDDMPGQMRALYRFLDVDESFIPETTRLLEGHYTERMSDSDHAYLRAAHRKDTEELESFTGWDLSAWKLRRGAGTTAARAARS